MENGQVDIRREGEQIMVATLDRPHKANAYTQGMLKTLHDALDEVRRDEQLRAFVITGSGERAFCAGADLTELGAFGADDAHRLLSRQVFDALAALPIPTLAAINGAAVGGGLELALACDLRVCVPGARFFLPEISHGLIPAAGATWRLPALVGRPRAVEMILEGRQLDAETALGWGLVSEVVPDVMSRALTKAQFIAQQDPYAVKAAMVALAPNAQEDQEKVATLQAQLYERRRLLAAAKA